MSYVDALFDRDRDRIHVVERVNGERVYREYPANYVFYYDDPRGRFQTIYGTPVTRFATRNSKEFHKELKINLPILNPSVWVISNKIIEVLEIIWNFFNTTY